MTARSRHARKARAKGAPVAAPPPAIAPAPLARWLDLRRGWTVALLCLLSAAVWQVIYAPFDIWPLAYVVLVPAMLAAIGAPGTRRALLSVLLGGAVANAIGLYWLTWVTLVGYVATVAVLSAFWLVPAWIVRAAWRTRRVPVWLSLPIAWTALEYARAYFLSGFPWFYLAHSQYRLPQLIQIADLTGAYGVSFFVAMVNGLIVGLLARWFVSPDAARPPRRAGWRRYCPTGGVVAVVYLAALLGYGTFRLSQDTRHPGPTFGVVQGSVPISLTGRSMTMEDIFDQYMNQAWTLADPARPVDVLVMPETMMPGFFTEPLWDLLPADPANPDAFNAALDMQRGVGRLIHRAGAPLVCGAATRRKDPGGETLDYNSAIFLTSAAGETPAPRETMGETPMTREPYRVGGIYDKMHLVPFSEYVPFKYDWPWLHRQLRRFVPPVMNQLEPGHAVRRFEIGRGGQQWRIATPICYEGTYARVCRALCYDGADKKADVLVNLSNDGWFIAGIGDRDHASTELAQHLSVYVFRAIENRVPVVRSVNTGISAHISSVGRIEGRISQPGRPDGTLAIGSARWQVLVDDRSSVYSRIGDLAAQACSAAAAGLLVFARLGKRSKIKPSQGAKSR